MRLHRFYVGAKIELTHDLWLHDEAILHQWRKVLRFRPGQEVVLFDGLSRDRLYKLEELKEDEAHLKHVTDFERKLPKKDIYLLWALLKKDKNDWVLQKATELGVGHFWPIIAERSEKLGFNVDRAQKIVIEAAEQCGRSDIPSVREPISVTTSISDLRGKVQLMVAEQKQESRIENQEGAAKTQDPKSEIHDSQNPIGILVGPEGGWSEKEKQQFKNNGLPYINLHDFTLRAETAAVTAVTKLLQ